MKENSSNSDNGIHQGYHQLSTYQTFQKKKNKDYVCPCGRSYGSYPALYSHIKQKHDGNAPGEVIKPKPNRRRGRPFKYQPVNLQFPNAHKNASKHLEDYLRISQNDQFNQFPLRGFANQDPSKINFMSNPDDEQFLRYYFMKNNRQNPSIWTKNDEKLRQPNQYQKQSNIPFVGQHLLNNDMEHYFRMREDEKRGRMQQFHQPDGVDIFESIYCKPYELKLKQEMQEKFNPIAHGISQFLQPILKQLIASQQSVMTNQQNNGHSNELQGDKSKEVIEIIDDDSNDEKREVNVNNVNAGVNENKINKDKVMEVSIQQCNNNNVSDKKSLQCKELLQNDHLRDIVRWMMSPPQQLSEPIGKQNYIENSFRCCLVEFLDFTNQFLQKVQYQQILLVLVFFCDHILASTGSFQNRPQPLVYQMFMYFNSFLSQYLPKLINFMPLLDKLFIFIDYKKKISELFMWMSTWQAVQQYYHNRYFRERILHELQQESMKNMQYQQKYNTYINQAHKQNIFGETINNNTYPLQQQSQHLRQYQHHQQQQLPQQKTEQNPQQIQFNPPINNHFHNNNQIHPQYHLESYADNNEFNQQQYQNDRNNINIALLHHGQQNGVQFIPQHVELQQINQLPQLEQNENNQQQQQSNPKSIQQQQHVVPLAADCEHIVKLNPPKQ